MSCLCLTSLAESDSRRFDLVLVGPCDGHSGLDIVFPNAYKLEPGNKTEIVKGVLTRGLGNDVEDFVTAAVLGSLGHAQLRVVPVEVVDPCRVLNQRK